ncbi:MAG: hypothetical protein QOE03_3177, partial [Micromonosporaceae bacterium]|nr:hypothetical protein [Micromonosporaceae bacterium]
DNDDRLGFRSGTGHLNVRVLPDDWHLDDVPIADVTFDLLYREVFAYYEQVYSFMRSEVFSLADECKVLTYPRLIWQMCDPRNRTRTYYMPPSRDLSAPRARLLLRFMRAQQAVTDVPVLVAAGRRAAAGITRRGELWTALKSAATIELAVMLQYLFAAYSVPTHGAGREYVRRGLWTAEQLRLACGDGGETTDSGVRGTLLTVAREEMIHFLLVNNIIMAMGEPFHVPLVDFGTVDDALGVPVDFALEPLGIGSLQRFIAIERPADRIGEVLRGGEAHAGDGYASISDLYAAIRDGLRRVPEPFMVRHGRGGGEHHLFLRQSINAVHPDFQLEVDDLSSALFAIDVITEQGEGNTLSPVPGTDGSPDAAESHYTSFLRLSDLLMAERIGGHHHDGPPWTPAYPVIRNPTLREIAPGREAVTDPDARDVGHLFNRSYYLMLQLMVQHFGWTPDASLRRSKLMNAAIDVMTGMMSPLAELLVTMPSGRRGATAGPSFELMDSVRYNARPDVAMRSIALRFSHLAAAAGTCDAVPDRVPEMFAHYAGYFDAFATSAVRP